MRYLAGLIVIALVAACNDSDVAVKKNTASGDDSTQYTTIQWLDSSMNYGKIEEGKKLDVAFRFKNTGDKPLVIRSVRPSCGCTVPNPPDKPIAPGQEGVINASFNSEGKFGLNSKELYVNTNTKEQNDTLHFEVEVLKKQ